MGIAEALDDSSSSTSPSAANMPLPVISFHKGAEHGFLKERKITRGLSSRITAACKLAITVGARKPLD
jgi:hypothetical protein